MLAMIVLWASTAYLGKYVSKISSLITALPAMFMSAVCTTYILTAEEGLSLSSTISYPIGLGVAILFSLLYTWKILLKKE